MSAHEAIATIEISVAGANCPWCFNDTIEVIRAAPGVAAVRGSISEQCLSIDHDGSDEATLVALVSRNLHGEAVYAAEHVMVEVQPHVEELQCGHGTAHDSPGCNHV